MNILLAHGSSAASHAEQVRSLADTVGGLLGEEVGVAFLDDERLPDGARVLPLFLGEGTHVREDIPQLEAKSDCTLLPSLSAHAEAIAELAYDLATVHTRRLNVLFALYRFAGFEALAAALHNSNKRCSLVAMGSLHSEPSVSSVLQHWQGEGIDRVTLQPMLLFEGRTMDRVRGMTEGFGVTINPPLSGHDGFAALIAACLKETHDGIG